LSQGSSPGDAPSDGSARFASVAVAIPVRRLFTYSVPERLSDDVRVGSRVRVRFSNRRIVGTVVDYPAEPPEEGVEARPIDAIESGAPILPPEILELTRFMADYYLCSWGEAIETALPPTGGRGPVRRFVRRLPEADPDGLPERATAKRRLLQLLPADGASWPVDRLDEAQRRLLPALERMGWIERIEKHVARPLSVAGEAGDAAATPPTPTEGQKRALAELQPLIERDEFAAVLLDGATGSGKTEIYFRAAATVLGRGRGVIYLVPEIGLTPILLSRVAERFAGQAVVMHSALSAGARRAAWDALKEGRSKFVVVRGRSERAVVLMGSATPSMESYHHAKTGRYHLVHLGGRVDHRPLAEVLVVDMRREYEIQGRVTPLSETLKIALGECLERGEQALVLRNRRGWAPALCCPRCGERVSCGQCSIALTWHRGQNRLKCHYCAFETSYPESCPTCGGDDLKLLGEGTEQVEDLLRREFPDARIERMDRDALRRRGAHEELLRRFERGKIDILVGTQMIAKGHDFHRVTLVGVISADQSLGMPDFRAGERTFQLLTQVAGRAGRGERPGRVVAQSFDPTHPVILQAVAQDFEKFYERELGYRRALRYPPFTAVVRVLVLDARESRAREWAETMAEALREASAGRLLISGPGPAPIERLKGLFRIQILVRSAGRRRLVQAVDRALSAVEGRVPRRAMQVDVDPISVL